MILMAKAIFPRGTRALRRPGTPRRGNEKKKQGKKNKMQLQNPLLSLTATGKFGNDIVIQHRANSYSGSLPFSREDIGSDEQLLQRDYFDRALVFWRAAQMSQLSRQGWLALCARFSLPMSGYNMFMRWSLLSMVDVPDPASAIFSADYPGGAYAWQLKDLKTGGACVDSDVFKVWAWQRRAARALLYSTTANPFGSIVLPAALRPPAGTTLSISVGSNHRSGCVMLGLPPGNTWQELKDQEITWGELKAASTTWGTLKTG